MLYRVHINPTTESYITCAVDKSKGKSKVHPRTGHDGPEGE